MVPDGLGGAGGVARRVYLDAGFALVAEEPHRSFGADLVGRTYELELAGSGASTG